MVSHWTGDNTPSDSVGSNDATFYNGTTYTAGQVGQAFRFDGNNDRAIIADDPSLALTGSLSIEAWANADSYATKHGIILFRGDDRDGLDPYQLTVTSSGQLRFGISGGGTDGAGVAAPMPLGEFVHVVGTLDDATGGDDGILKFDATTGASLGEFIASGEGGLDNPTRMAWSPDGNFYVSSTAASINSVLRYFRSGAFKDTFVPSDAVGLDGPTDLVFNSGLLYVGSARTASVLTYDASTGDIVGAAVLPGSGGLNTSNSLLFDNEGNLLVSGRASGQIHK